MSVLDDESPSAGQFVALPGGPDTHHAAPAVASGVRGGTRTAPPISRRGVQDCRASAEFWSEVLAYQADLLQQEADTWSISAGRWVGRAGSHPCP